MLLGKRPRPAMQRTTSMTEFTPDLDAMIMDAVDASQPSDAQKQQQLETKDLLQRGHVAAAVGLMSPRNNNHRRHSGDFRFLETAPFLKACGLCKRRLGPGRDIYIYRGEVAFCSLECRQQLMSQEERKEKCALSSIKTETPSTTVASGSEVSATNSGGETVAAA